MSNKLKLTLSLFIGLFVFFGCNVQKREIAKQHALNYKYPASLAEDCERQFPVRDSIGPAIYSPANNIDYSGKLDSAKQSSDSLKAAINMLVNLPNDTAKLRRDLLLITQRANTLFNKLSLLQTNYEPCLPDTIKIPHYLVDNAAVEMWESRYKIKNDSLSIVKGYLIVYKTKADKFSLWFWIENGIIAAALLTFIGIKAYSFFSGGAIAKKLL